MSSLSMISLSSRLLEGSRASTCLAFESASSSVAAVSAHAPMPAATFAPPSSSIFTARPFMAASTCGPNTMTSPTFSATMDTSASCVKSAAPPMQGPSTTDTMGQTPLMRASF